MIRWLLRLLLVAFAITGVWLWQGGGGMFAVTRELVWQLPGKPNSIREVEIQLWDGESLIKRELTTFPASISSGAGSDIFTKVPLRNGKYIARAFIRRSESAPVQAISREVHLDNEKTIVIDLSAP